MSSTKIINVLKDDSFAEILTLFKAAPAEEVIFVLPKRCKAFQKDDHFSALRAECKSLGKSVSFLCSNPEVNDIAKKYRFDVLLARPTTPRLKKAGSVRVAPNDSGSISVVNQIEDFYAEPTKDSDSISTVDNQAEEDTPVEEFAPAVVSTPIRKNVAKTETSWGNLIHKSAKSFSKPISKLVPYNNSRAGAPTRRAGLVVLGCAVVVVLGTVVVATTGSAKVTIKPASQDLSLDLIVFTSDNVSSVDSMAMIIPGQAFNIPKTVSQDFTATGHVDVAQKARGTITVYNELPVNQQLIATTRFQSADGHIFHTLTSIIVPAGKTMGGKLVPGNKDVQVIADKPGSEYNVAVGLFTVPAFKERNDTEKFQKIYGQSDAPFLNGTSGQATVVTESDLASAKQVLIAQVIKNVQDELKTEISALKIINDNQVVVGNLTSTGQVDPTTKTFSANISGTLKTVGFKESDLNELITQYVAAQKGLVVLPDKLTITYNNAHWDEAKKGLSFTTHVVGLGYSKIDLNKVVSDLLGKNNADMTAYLSGISGITSAHVDLSPFWVRSVPTNQAKVHIDLSY
jgi:hypothetical protein